MDEDRLAKSDHRERSNFAARVNYWHAGRRGLRPGDLLRSPYERRHEMSGRERHVESVAIQAGYNADRDPQQVYFTTDRELARGWAVTRVHGGGSVGLSRAT